MPIPSPSQSGTPPMGSSPMGMKLAQPGNAAAAVAGVRQAIELLQSNLPNIPMGSELHKAVLESVTKLAKHAAAADASPGVQQTAGKNLMQSQQQGAPYEALMKALGGAGGAQAAA